MRNKQVAFIGRQTGCPYWGTQRMSLLRDKQLPLLGTNKLPFLGNKQVALLGWQTNQVQWCYYYAMESVTYRFYIYFFLNIYIYIIFISRNLYTTQDIHLARCWDMFFFLLLPLITINFKRLWYFAVLFRYCIVWILSCIHILPNLNSLHNSLLNHFELWPYK